MKLEKLTVTLDGQEYELPIGDNITRYDAVVLFLGDLVQAVKNSRTSGKFEYAILDEDDVGVRRRRR